MEQDLVSVLQALATGTSTVKALTYKEVKILDFGVEVRVSRDRAALPQETKFYNR